MRTNRGLGRRETVFPKMVVNSRDRWATAMTAAQSFTQTTGQIRLLKRTKSPARRRNGQRSFKRRFWASNSPPSTSCGVGDCRAQARAELKYPIGGAVSCGQRHRSCYFPSRCFGFSACSAGGTNRPSLRISFSSNQISPPPCSGRWMHTRSQCTCERLPFSVCS